MLQKIAKFRLSYALVWITFYLVCISVASLVFLYELPLPDQVIKISSAEFSPVQADNHQNYAKEKWELVTLPDNWRQQGDAREKVIDGWYKLNFEIEKIPDSLSAILFSSSRMNIAVYLNGVFLGDGGRFLDPVARNWMTPLLFSIPDTLFVSGVNNLRVRLKSDLPGKGFLPELYIAKYDDLKSTYDSHYFFRITSVQIVTILLFIQSIIFGFLWYMRKQEIYYGYYAIATLLWAIHNFHIFTINIPISTQLWDWFSYGTLGFYAFISVFFFHRFFNEKIPKIEIPIIVFSITFFLILYILEGEIFYLVANSIWYPAAVLAGLYGTSYLVVNAWKYRNAELQIIAASGIITMFYATHDILVKHNLINWGNGFYIQFAAAVLLPGFAIIMLYRFASSLDEAESLNLDLENRVEEKHQALKINLEKLQKLENQRIRTEERERLILDIHDGMGGNLVSTLAMIEMGNASIDDIAEALRNSLDDMHLVINSMDIEEDELLSILGFFKARISQKLKKSRIKIIWNIEDVPVLQNLNPRNALHILRILQEAFTNTIKHANADTVTFSVKCVNEESTSNIIIEINDNGNGFVENRLSGRGISNMYNRAISLGGKLLIDSTKKGTNVKLVLKVISQV